jgi:hypothetical protein
MRMSNDRDQGLLRSAVSDSAANLFAFVPALGTREALGFGAGIPLPTRLTFAELPPHLLPRSEAFASDQDGQPDGEDINFIASVVERWRSATMRHKAGVDESAREPRQTVAPDAVPLQPDANAGAAVPEATRLSLLKKPLAERPDPYAAARPAAAAAAAAAPQVRWPK